jgi:hypothetical protein
VCGRLCKKRIFVDRTIHSHTLRLMSLVTIGTTTLFSPLRENASSAQASMASYPSNHIPVPPLEKGRNEAADCGHGQSFGQNNNIFLLASYQMDCTCTVQKQFLFLLPLLSLSLERRKKEKKETKTIGKGKGRKGKSSNTVFELFSNLHFHHFIIINITACTSTCTCAMIFFLFLSFLLYFFFYIESRGVCAIGTIFLPNCSVGQKQHNPRQRNATQHEIRNRKRAEQGNLIFLRSASTIKSSFLLPPPTRLVHRSRYSSGTVHTVQQQRKPPRVGRHDEVKIQFASSILAELAAGNWGWVYRVGLAGIDAAVGLGLEKLTAQPLHLVKVERNFESAESRRRKKKVQKKASLFSLQPQHASTLTQMGGESLTINHLSLTSGD